MSHPSRPRPHHPADADRRRRARKHKPDAVLSLEERCLLTPYVTIGPATATFVPTTATLPTGVASGSVNIILNSPSPTFASAAPLTSISQLTPISSFGGDIVR